METIEDTAVSPPTTLQENENNIDLNSSNRANEGGISNANGSSNINDSNKTNLIKPELMNDDNLITALASSNGCVHFTKTKERGNQDDSPLCSATATVLNIGTLLARSSPLSREFLALQKSLNDSKILTEFVTETSSVKTARKGRKSGSAVAISGNREISLTKTSNGNRGDFDTISNEESTLTKRANMRSRNSEFAQKHMDFLNRVIQQQQSGDEQYASDIEEIDRYTNSNADDDDDRHTNISISSIVSSDLPLHDFNNLETRLKGVWLPPPKSGWDSFCWRCRECHGSIRIPCSKCLRCFHKTCIKVSSNTKLDNSWNCPECLAIENVLSSPKKARRSELTLEMLNELLIFALNRMRTLKASSTFMFADVDLSDFRKFIMNPVTFTSLEEKITKKAYKCSEEFYNETKWMIHNAHILTTGLPNNKQVVAAKSVLKVCRQETTEIETCPSCYFSANTKSDWFVDVCTQPHLLLWAKLKGFPYWPAKAMGVGQNAAVNVRFFGKHDRAFVPIKDCFLFSEQDPNSQTAKRSARELADCIKEVEEHIKKIKGKIGKFNYAPFKTPYDPTEEKNQLELMMPGVSEYMQRQQEKLLKPSLQYKIVKTADNNLSIIKKHNKDGNSNDASEMTHDFSENFRKQVNKATTSTAAIIDSSTHLTSKYEVITKSVCSDNSSKLSTVILKKRKSQAFINNEANEDNTAENNAQMPLEKVSKPTSTTQLENNLFSTRGDFPVSSNKNHQVNPLKTSVGPSRNLCKRKLDILEASSNSKNTDNVEKDIVKHIRSEPRLPIYTIKAASAKIVEPTAHEVAENFAKSNMCVTIKKIPKTNLEGLNIGFCNSTNVRDKTSYTQDFIPVNTNAAPSSFNGPFALQTTEAEDTSICSPLNATNPLSSVKASHPKSVQKQEEQNIFLELVPFVEIKQEMNSDVEREHASSNTLASATHAKKIVSDVPSVPTSTPISVQTDDGNCDNEAILLRVKEEPVSEEEEDAHAKDTFELTERAINNLDDTNNDSLKTVSPINTCSEKIPANTIRVVGDTTIQRVSDKKSAISSTVQKSTVFINPIFTPELKHEEVAPKISSNVVETSQLQCILNRSAADFCVLPDLGSAHASKSTSLSSSKVTSSPAIVCHSHQTLMQQHVQLHQNQHQRGRKSIPNGPDSSPGTSSNISPSETRSPPFVTSSVGEIKRGAALKLTSMVSIPADIAAHRKIPQNSMPMPLLTAVSKTSPVISVAKNSGGSTYSTLSSSTALITGNSSGASVAFASKINTTGKVGNLHTSTKLICAPNQPSKICKIPEKSALSYPKDSTLSSDLQIESSADSISKPPVLLHENIARLHNANAETDSSIATENHLRGNFDPTKANAITEAICRGPPKMARRPNGPLQSDGSKIFQSDAGPVCQTLIQNAHKLTDFFISVMEDTMCEMKNSDEPSLQAKITLLSIELERMKQEHEKEIAELKRTSDAVLFEMRRSMESEKSKVANEIRKQCELERLRCVEEAKRKQWCANCGREAQFYCCWNTSYCDYPCQQQHWGRHAATCAQTRDASPSTTASATIGNLQSVLTTTSSMNTHGLNAEVINKTYTKNAKSMNINIQYSKNRSNTKKETHTPSSTCTITSANKNSVNISIPQSDSIKTNTLKLPTNTYLRPIVSNVFDPNVNNLRSSGVDSMEAARFNVLVGEKLPLKRT